jgi:beta-lactamase superfamily II metal-dependent hydrolase
MIYHGFEVFFLFLNNADSILIRHHNQGVKTVILVDGGRKGHTPIVRQFLRDMGESELDHLVCSHHHEDHAGGLVELVSDTTLTIRRAWVHLGDLLVDRIDQSRFKAFTSLLRRAQASKETQRELVKALLKRGITPEEPFAVAEIGPLCVVSPTEEFYNSQLELIREESVAKALNNRYHKRDTRAMMEAIGFTKDGEDDSEDDGDLGGETTSPENEISTILVMPWTGADGLTKYFLLTADAGTAALADLQARSENAKSLLKAVKWMQLPHHGSRRNMNIELLDYYKPEVGFVSAEGSKKHPSVKLVNAVKERGGEVYSTHYPPKKNEGVWLRQSCGTVPEISTIPAKPLWDAPAL